MTNQPTPPFTAMSADDLAVLMDAPGAPSVPSAHREAVIELLVGLRGHAAVLARTLAASPVVGVADETFVP